MTTYTTAAFVPLTLDAEQQGRFDRALAGHDEVAPLDRGCLVYVCLTCGSVAMASDEADVPELRERFDMSCCESATTIFPTF